MNELVSIIIPTNNGKDILLKTLESAMKQTYSPIEIIIVDDNGLYSEEQRETELMLRPFIDNKKIKYLPLKNHKNGSFARNAGYSISSGQYIMYLDDDDLLFPKKIECEMECARKNNSDMVVCGAYFINHERIGYVERPIKGENFLYDYLTGKYMFNTSTLLFKREVIEYTGGFDDTFNRHQDWEFCIRVISDFKVDVVQEPLVIKLSVKRNFVSDPDMISYYRQNLLNKRAEYINRLGEKSARKIYEYHYIMLAISYLRCKRLEDCKLWIRKCHNPMIAYLQMIEMCIKLKFRKITKGEKKFTEQDVCNLV